ncbi:MAG: phosphomannomutase, partial [Alphaproteobacteria bacterium]|nr:phosphomannomutase [Alphaproteobacteria bacterium]
MSNAGHAFDPTVLREYDVRGVVGRTLGEADARALGRAFGTILRRKGGTRIAVGYDGRLTSPVLEAALVEGLIACGLSVLRIGRGPTPMLSWSTHALVDGSGVMVTGSHNPPDHNGFKMTLAGKPFFGADIQALRRLAASGDFVDGKGAVETVDPREDYAARLAGDVPTDTFATLAWDPGHGATAEILNLVLQKATGHHHVINGIIDGHFPAHHP